mgnify:FL=1
MKFNGKHIAITAGLGAVLALSPVVGPMATAFAQSNNGAAATQAQGHFVGFRITDPETGTPVDFPNYTTDGNEKVDPDKIPTVPSYEDWEFVGWEDTETGKVYSASDLTAMVIWEDVTFQTKWNYVGQGEPEEPAEQINVTFQYDNTSVATVADENGNIDAAGLDLPENYTWSWTDSQGTVHEFGSDKLAGYIFTESCTVTGVPAEDPEEPVDPEDPVNEYITVHLVDTDDTPIRDVVVQNGTSNWSDRKSVV